MTDFQETPPTPPIFEIPKTNRHGKWTIEVPTFSGANSFLADCKKVIPDALEECDPRVRRFDVIAQFPPKLLKETSAGMASTLGRFDRKDGDNKILIAISIDEIQRLSKKYPTTPPKVFALWTLLHEVLEANYRLVTTNNPLEEASLMSSNYSEYYESELERTINQKCLALIKRNIGGNYVLQEGIIRSS